MRLAAAFIALTLAGAAQAAPACPPGDFPSFYNSRVMFDTAIERAGDFIALEKRPDGIIVPHHLLADRLVAGGIKLAAGHDYDRIILLSPDHFRQTERAFATTTRGFDTVLGKVSTDFAAARRLLAESDKAEESCLFIREHGIAALLPLVAHYLPGVPVLPVAISIRSSRADWEALVAALTQFVGERTLILQSTDFSHFLPHHEARQRDQQTLNVLASGALDDIAKLNQPQHMDSLGAMYVHAALQQRLRGSRLRVVANENGQQYDGKFVAETTSYLVGAFLPPAAAPLPLPGGAHRLFLAGDTFFGRAMSRALIDELAAERVERAVLDLTGGAPLVVNLEGVLLPDLPPDLPELTLAMPAAQAIDWFKRLNVVAASLANNHAFDLGDSGYAETVEALEAAGIKRFGQGEAIELPGVRIVGLTDLGTNDSQATRLIDPAMLDRLLSEDAETPVVAFAHWGEEYVAAPGERERELAEEMRRRGVAAIVGAHPHRASDGIASLGGGDTALVYSLGNFLFDQSAQRASGALAELTLFEQGTVFVREVPLPNLFDMARGRQQEPPNPGSR